MSKSMFSNSMLSTATRSIYNPISTVGTGGTGTGSGGGGGGGGTELSLYDYNQLKIIENQYGSNMSKKQYENIPNDYNKYVQLYVILQKMYTKTKNTNLLLLLKIAEHTLVGAVNSYAIYGDNIALRLDKSNLEQRVQDILSNKNQRLIEIANSTGQLSITKTFKLAPVFNYYIKIYGLPAYGVGFDPTKISYLVGVLNKMGINPYK